MTNEKDPFAMIDGESFTTYVNRCLSLRTDKVKHSNYVTNLCVMIHVLEFHLDEMHKAGVSFGNTPKELQAFERELRMLMVRTQSVCSLFGYNKAKGKINSYLWERSVPIFAAFNGINFLETGGVDDFTELFNRAIVEQNALSILNKEKENATPSL